MNRVLLLMMILLAGCGEPQVGIESRSAKELCGSWSIADEASTVAEAIKLRHRTPRYYSSAGIEIACAGGTAQLTVADVQGVSKHQPLKIVARSDSDFELLNSTGRSILRVRFVDRDVISLEEETVGLSYFPKGLLLIRDVNLAEPQSESTH